MTETINFAIVIIALPLLVFLINNNDYVLSTICILLIFNSYRLYLKSIDKK